MDYSKIDDWHPLTLPSKGLYYRDANGNDLCPGGEVQISPWKTYQEEAMIKYGGINSSEFMSKLLQNNLQLPAGMTTDDLLMTDEFFILVQLRCLSLTPYATCPYTCPQCNNTEPVQVNFLDMDVVCPDETWPDEPVRVELPVSGHTVDLRFMRVKDLAAIQSYEVKSNHEASSSHYLARRVKAINGQPVKDFLQTRELLDKLVMLDSQILASALDEYETGYVMQTEIACKKCGFKYVAAIARDASFFRPRRIDLERQAQDLRESRQRS